MAGILPERTDGHSFHPYSQTFVSSYLLAPSLPFSLGSALCLHLILLWEKHWPLLEHGAEIPQPLLSLSWCLRGFGYMEGQGQPLTVLKCKSCDLPQYWNAHSKGRDLSHCAIMQILSCPQYGSVFWVPVFNYVHRWLVPAKWHEDCGPLNNSGSSRNFNFNFGAQ